MKFVTFVKKNPDFPFPVKHKVLSSALLAAILYGCESWFVNNVMDVNKLYISSIKTLLGVRQTTSNDVCLLELGYPHLKYWIKQKQVDFLRKAINLRQGIGEDPLSFTINLCTNARTPAGRYITDLLNHDNYFLYGVQIVKDNVRNSTRSKLMAYRSMNPKLSVHNVYTQLRPVIPEFQRIYFTRLRVISHEVL